MKAMPAAASLCMFGVASLQLVQAVQVAVTQIVGEDEDDVGPCSWFGGRNGVSHEQAGHQHNCHATSEHWSFLKSGFHLGDCILRIGIMLLMDPVVPRVPTRPLWLIPVALAGAALMLFIACDGQRS